MGFATHLGPWLLGTVKNTTGTTAGTVCNTGCTVVAQSGTTTVADTTADTLFWICLLYTSPSPRDRQKSRMPSSA